MKNPIDDHIADIFGNGGRDFKDAMQAVSTQLKKRIHALMETEAGGWINSKESSLVDECLLALEVCGTILRVCRVPPQHPEDLPRL